MTGPNTNPHFDRQPRGQWKPSISPGWKLPISPKTSEVYVHTTARGHTLPMTADFLTLRLSKTSEVW